MSTFSKLMDNKLVAAILFAVIMLAPFHAVAELVEVEEVVIEKKLPKRKIKRIVRKAPAPKAEYYESIEEEEEFDDYLDEEEPRYEVRRTRRAAPTAAQPQRLGSRIDTRIDQKVDSAKDRLEEKFLEKLDSIDFVIKDHAQKEEKQEEAPAPVVEAAPVYVDTLVDSAAANEKIEVSEAQANPEEEKKGNKQITLYPTIGMSNISSDNYEIDSSSSVGLGIEAEIGQNVSLMFGFTYSQYDITLATDGYYFGQFDQFGQPAGINYLSDMLSELEYKQNVFDAGVKYTFFHHNSKIRPYLGGGAGLVKGYLNYPQEVIDYGLAYAGPNAGTTLDQDYEVTSYLAYINLGTDVNFSQTFAIGAGVKYYTVVGSSEEGRIRNDAFFKRNGTAVGSQHFNGKSFNDVYNGVGETDKDFLGGSLKDNGFYSIQAMLKFRF